jgi:hypothetical protein
MLFFFSFRDHGKYPFCFKHRPAAAANGTRLPLQLTPGKKVVLVAGWEVDSNRQTVLMAFRVANSQTVFKSALPFV